jgi:hypothetical protein
MAKKLPQNIQALIGEIGERQVLLRLLLYTLEKPWQVFQNMNEFGFDILLVNTSTGREVRVEVKTRQRIYTTGKANRPVHFTLTNGEYRASDFLIAYFLDFNEFYVVPTEDLKKSRSGNKVLWKYILGILKDGTPSPVRERYLDRWDPIFQE